MVHSLFKGENMKHPLKLVSGLASLAIIAGGLTSIAPAANAAANQTIVWDCTADDISVDLQVGDTITFASSDCPDTQASGVDPRDNTIVGFTAEDGLLNWLFNLPYVPPQSPLTIGVTVVSANLTTNLSPGDTIAWLSKPRGVSPTTVARVIYDPTIIDPTGSVAGPDQVRQGLPMPASGLCADVQDAQYAWGTGLTGGWLKSWQPWANPTRAEGDRWGWTCIRVMVNTGGSTWVIDNSGA